MMSLKVVSLLFLGWCMTIFQTSSGADVLVQLNINRPLNDVNEKFVNFAIKPEELYRALDGDNRRIITRMAAMLGESYLKFTNDYEFAMNSGMKLRNPTKIIWKGFNRWARAVNWTMVIPLPYDPDTWDPIETLRILNSSYLAGINDCVWQLGTDFGASHAEDYVAELSTLNLMVESFKPYVADWRIMGADISAGSSAEETRRYIEMSKDLNSAFGWTQSSQPNSPLASVANDNEPALRVLLREKVPVWMTLPQKAKLKQLQTSGNVIISDEATEALNWAKTLGEAANTGYDAVFRRITASDLERPNFSYYVSALFKKVMGSRVFPARPLHMFTKSNKLYTHCANSVSGGIAFMIVNSNEQPLQVQIHSLSRIAATEIWQYTLTMKKSATLLNNERLWYNSTLRPQKTHKQPHRSIQLNTPARSVSFWVLPNVNLDHCQYTEIGEDELNNDSGEQDEQQDPQMVKRYSSMDKLLRKLIQESSVANNPLVRAMTRRRRFATNSGRFKRFILKDKSIKPKGWGAFFRPLADEPKLSALAKREHAIKPEDPLNPFYWLTNLMDTTMTGELPLLRRGPRSINNDDYFGPLFATKGGKTTTAYTKKITEIKKPERNVKSIFNMEEFDEEEFFKKLENYQEPMYSRLPEGDVMLQFITSPDGEEIDELAEDRTKQQSQEIVSEMKPLKLLPTEFYESMPPQPLRPTNPTTEIFGDNLNVLISSDPEPIQKKPSKTKKALNGEKNGKSAPKGVPKPVSEMAREFISKQKELSKTFGEENEKSAERDNEENAERLGEHKAKKPISASSSLDMDQTKESKTVINQSFQDFHQDQPENFFENEEHEINGNYQTNADGLSKQKFEELPWWDLDLLKQKRSRRALYFNLLDDDLHNNLISKDEEISPLGGPAPSERLVVNEKHKYSVENGTVKDQLGNQEISTEKKLVEHKFLTTFKEKLSNFVDAVARQLSGWYDTITKHIDSSLSSGKKIDQSN